MTVELIIGMIGFGTAIVGLVTAYVSRTRHVIHCHEDLGQGQSKSAPPMKIPDVELDIDQGETALSREEIIKRTGTEEPSSNKYGLAAVRAVELCRDARVRMTPPEAWELATSELFRAGTPSQLKGCPKGAFLGLCQAGYVVGVPRGDYSRSEKNRDYAVTAAELLGREPELASDLARLWRRVLCGVTKQHNSQMHVVLALWRSGLLSIPVKS